MAQASFGQRIQTIENRSARRYVPDSQRGPKTVSFLWSLGLGVAGAFAGPVLAKFAPEMLAFLPEGLEPWIADAAVAGVLSLCVAFAVSLTSTKHVFSLMLGLGLTIGVMHDLLPDPQTVMNSDPAELRVAYLDPVLAYLPADLLD
ncbi:hypothetical protein [Pseudaestuariivita atlantica]|uniref:Uncharacterized protein n=1 Tax=Pseudaestuariivita atlantica TaxID=1317121 RepID=A0A0L1JUZ7_9RHOB|nr:hypothetical protein [Pseudaestuariivita atlantica]KNG95228.1 hypothetical protein ATO11_00880 [Pseudaestuariivita atlantica]